MDSSRTSQAVLGRVRVVELWFDDGNLVIAAGSHLFRVHRSIMSMHSSVFRDMLLLPPSSSQAMYEGVPLLELSDNGDEVKCFLTALYLPEHFPLVPEGGVLPLEALIGALRLSHKYDVPFLRRRTLRAFSSEYILDIDDVTKCQLPSWRSAPSICSPGVTFDQDQWKQVQEELSVAREVGALWVLPQLLYEASYAPAAMIRTSTLDRAEILNCYAGYYATHAKSATSPGFLFDPASRNRGPMCNACAVTYSDKYIEWRRDFWSRIPEFYGLPGWRELKEMKAKAFEGPW